MLNVTRHLLVVGKFLNAPISFPKKLIMTPKKMLHAVSPTENEQIAPNFHRNANILS